MTKQEAHLFFSYDEEADIEECWEEHFFAQKQYFLTHTPIPKVWLSKIRRLSKQYEAFLVLSDQEMQKAEQKNGVIPKIDFPENFIAAFHQLHQLRTQHKSKILQVENPFQMGEAIKAWLEIETQYAHYWSVPESEKMEIPVAQSKEPDPMEWIACMKRTSKEIKSNAIHDLKMNYKNLPADAQKEVKRLTLLSKS